MKKILLSIMLLSISFLMKAQVIFSEDFEQDNVLQANGWTLIDADGDGHNFVAVGPVVGGTKVLASNSFLNGVGALTPNNYIFTPKIDLTSYAAGSVITLTYDHRAPDKDWDAEKYNVYVTDAPTVAATEVAGALVHEQSTMDNINQFEQVSIDLSNFAGQEIYICIRHFDVSDQYAVWFDNIVVKKAYDSDAEMLSLTATPNSVPVNTPTTIKAVVKNAGTQPLTDFQIKWTIDGTETTEDVNGQNLAFGATYEATKTHTFTTAGDKNISAEVILTGDEDNTNTTKTITVPVLAPTDIALSSIRMGVISPINAETSIYGVIENKGTDTLTTGTTFDLKLTVDGAESTQTINITEDVASGATFNFLGSHTFTTSGNKTIKAEVILADDAVATNNTAPDMTTQVSSGTAERLPFLERFTSATCGPCKTYNEQSFNQFAQNYDDYAIVYYQMNFPGVGDDYYIAGNGARFLYYGLSGVPSLVWQGIDIIQRVPGNQLANFLNSVKQTMPATAELAVTKEINGNNIKINVEGKSFVQGNYKLFVMVIEKKTTGNVKATTQGGNGETEFRNVVHKFVTGPQGEDISLSNDTAFNKTYDIDMSSTNVEEMSDLGVVVFIQDLPSKYVLQAARTENLKLSVEPTEVDELAIGLYPNPANDVVTLTGIANDTAVVTITDLNGRTVQTINKVNDNQAINVTELQTGVYFISVETANGKTVKKLIKK